MAETAQREGRSAATATLASVENSSAIPQLAAQPLDPLASHHPSPPAVPVGPARFPWGPRLRVAGFVLVNLWLVWHLAAITIAPWSVPPSSRLVQNSWRVIGPYVQLLFLNHGYHYFAPEPGSSTLLAYDLELSDGRHVSGRIPNREIRPRLLYHRHFMLTEFLGSSDYYPPTIKTELVRAFARQLCRENQARRVSLSRLTHRLPAMEWVRAGGPLDDPNSYTEEPLGSFSCDEL
jgi:hypothetical protein